MSESMEVLVFVGTTGTFLLALAANLVVVSRWSAQLNTVVEQLGMEVKLLREIVTRQERRISFIEGSLYEQIGRNVES